MKKLVIITVLLLASITQVFSQFIEIRLLENNRPIPYVTVVDTTDNLIGYTNLQGILSVRSSNLKLICTHISFLTDTFTIDTSHHKIIYEFEMKRKEFTIDPVLITSLKVKKDRYYRIGYLSYQKNKGLIDRLNTMLGIKLPNPLLKSGLLRSIRFGLLDVNNLSKRNFTLEIKVYSISFDGHLSERPINNNPIYIRSQQLKRKNEIILDDIIQLPKFGIFISVELPLNFAEHYDWTLNFAGSKSVDVPTTYLIKNKNGKWYKNLNQQQALAVDGQFITLNFSYTYWAF